MTERVTNWHLSIMVMIVSVISIAMIQNNVSAQWRDPNVSPEEGTNQVYFNPAVETLDLNNYTIIDNTEASFIFDPGGTYGLRVSGTDYAGWFDGNVNIQDGNLTIDGVEIEGGANRFIELLDTPNSYTGYGGYFIRVNNDENGLEFHNFVGPEGLWNSAGDDIYRDSYVGIGEPTPNVLLDIKSDVTHDATIDIRSGNNDFWRIYNDETSNDLRFSATGTNDVLTLKNTGSVLIATSTSQADLTVGGTVYFSGNDTSTLSVYNTGGSQAYSAIYSEGWNAIKGYSSYSNGIGVYGQSDFDIGISGLGAVGVHGSSTGSGAGAYGVHGDAGVGKYGGFFESYTALGAGVRGETSVGVAGVYGVGTEDNDGVRGAGYYGVSGFVNAAGGAGVYGQGSTTADAAYFEGDVIIAPLGSDNSYLRLATTTAEPSSGDCSAGVMGRMIVDSSNNRIWVCSSDGWRYTSLN